MAAAAAAAGAAGAPTRAKVAAALTTKTATAAALHAPPAPWPQQLLAAARFAGRARSSSSVFAGGRWAPLPLQLPAHQLQQRAAKHSALPGGAARARKATEKAMYLGAVVLLMIALSYGSVPLYQLYCQATGYGTALGGAGARNGVEEKLRRRAAAPDDALEAKARARELRVWFTSDVEPGLPWKFTPTQDFVSLRPGESTLAFFTAENKRCARNVAR